MSDSENIAEPIEIPFDAVSAEILDGIIDNYILRYGTDYGAEEVSYEARLNQVRKQIKSGHVKIFFEPNTETVTLLPATTKIT